MNKIIYKRLENMKLLQFIVKPPKPKPLSKQIRDE